MAGSKIGRAGQATTGRAAYGRAMGAQSRFALPQHRTIRERAGTRGAASSARMSTEWNRLLGALEERDRAEKLGAVAGLMRTGAAAFADFKDERAWEERRRKMLEDEELRRTQRTGEMPASATTYPKGLAPPPKPGRRWGTPLDWTGLEDAPAGDILPPVSAITPPDLGQRAPALDWGSLSAYEQEAIEEVLQEPRIQDIPVAQLRDLLARMGL